MAGADDRKVVVFGEPLVATSLENDHGVLIVPTMDGLISALVNVDATLGFVIWADAVSPADTERLVHAIQASGRRCIEVRAERWDGRTPSPLSAACGGVISGFGVNGMQAAVRLLSGA
jgi:3-dehydroquinate dehydratase